MTKNIFTLQASGAGRNELHELKFLPVEIMLDAMKNNPSVIPLKITIDTGMLKEVNTFL